MSPHAKFWLLWTIAGLTYELFFIFTGRPEGTLSWQIWGLRSANVRVFTAIWFLILWALYHFRYEGNKPNEGIKSFAIAVAAWLIFTYVIDPLTPPPVPAQVPQEEMRLVGGGPPPRDI